MEGIGDRRVVDHLQAAIRHRAHAAHGQRPPLRVVQCTERRTDRPDVALGIVEAVRSARDRWPGRTVHVECDRLEQVVQALDAGADALLLDNMTPDEVRAAVVVAEEHATTNGTRRALLEVSGGITLENVGSYAGTGADVVSSGSLTNSSPVLDIGLDIEVHR